MAKNSTELWFLGLDFYNSKLKKIGYFQREAIIFSKEYISLKFFFKIVSITQKLSSNPDR